ncbi:Cyclopropane-fatty-acyl-phospholipid synthase [Minicystis rosea]|nr:Cyclopropane-fatty-acyl-phospholipid synthase [Minicystis rosea]
MAQSFVEALISTPAAAAPALGVTFDICLPDRPARRIGTGQPSFQVIARNARATAALLSFDELRIGEAYLDGDLDIEGSLLAALDLRASFSDQHLLGHLFSTYAEPLLFGQVNRDKKWIHEHYDTDPDFYLLFLDQRHRCYSHGYFAHDEEPLEDAILRKLDTALTSIGVGPGARVLDIGAGWGAFTQHAARRGIHVTSLTISAASHRYVTNLIAREGLSARVLLDHFLEHRSDEPYDAIVNLGVTEHLPDYQATLAQYARLLKPGGRVFLDACSSRRKFPFTAFVRKHIWPGNASPLALADYTAALAETPLELCEVKNDRRNYELTTMRWAESLERHRETIVARWGERHYRRFRIYLWGCVQGFKRGDLGAYHLLLELPRDARSRKRPILPFRSPLFSLLHEALRGPGDNA